ncbi:MAG TPA: hypothetical protein VMF90_14905 [Rhizobiaceae bacterium]|nr:hypothetical protein [Rhizobiaceae bacterium]
MKTLAAVFLALMFVVFSAAGSVGQGARTIELTGTTIQAGPLSLEDIQKFPLIEQEVQFQTSKGEEKGRYKGALLWVILEAKGIKTTGHNEQLKRTFVVEGSDGYQIAFSIGEIDPDFGNLPITIAIERDGQPMVPGEGFRLIVPGDKRGARYVRDIVKIDVR